MGELACENAGSIDPEKLQQRGAILLNTSRSLSKDQYLTLNLSDDIANYDQLIVLYRFETAGAQIILGGANITGNSNSHTIINQLNCVTNFYKLYGNLWCAVGYKSTYSGYDAQSFGTTMSGRQCTIDGAYLASNTTFRIKIVGFKF